MPWHVVQLLQHVDELTGAVTRAWRALRLVVKLCVCSCGWVTGLLLLLNAARRLRRGGSRYDCAWTGHSCLIFLQRSPHAGVGWVPSVGHGYARRLQGAFEAVAWLVWV